ncbi:MAG: hypothetical protein GC136_10115 [Alphaproteobacteria bacterium]|nr:hypothetical protein [Alphaproteobacteria bacterium]
MQDLNTPYEELRVLAEQDEPLAPDRVILISRVLDDNPSWKKDLSPRIVAGLEKKLTGFLAQYNNKDFEILADHLKTVFNSANKIKTANKTSRITIAGSITGALLSTLLEGDRSMNAGIISLLLGMGGTMFTRSYKAQAQKDLQQIDLSRRNAVYAALTKVIPPGDRHMLDLAFDRLEDLLAAQKPESTLPKLSDLFDLKNRPIGSCISASLLLYGLFLQGNPILAADAAGASLNINEQRRALDCTIHYSAAMQPLRDAKEALEFMQTVAEILVEDLRGVQQARQLAHTPV